MALSKQVEVQREVAPHNCCSEYNPQRTTTSPFFLLLLQCCTFGCILPIPFSSTAPSDAVLQFCQPNVLYVLFKGSVTAEVLCMTVCVCVSDQCSCGGSRSSVRTTVHTAGVQPPLKGLSRTTLEGSGDGGQWLYLSPRIAYWLSSCKCCIEVPLVSSLPRVLCFTTSKVFSISLSLRVSTCLADASKEGN